MSEQKLAIELRLIVETPKMPANKLANGIVKIINTKWPECKVKLNKVHVNSVADSDLAYVAKDKRGIINLTQNEVLDEDENEGEATEETEED